MTANQVLSKKKNTSTYHPQSEASRKQDLVLLLLIQLTEDRTIPGLNVHSLQKIWELYIDLLLNENMDVPRFYADIVTERFRELDDAIFYFCSIGYVRLHHSDRIILTLTRGAIFQIKMRIDSKDLEIFKNVYPAVANAYSKLNHL